MLFPTRSSSCHIHQFVYHLSQVRLRRHCHDCDLRCLRYHRDNDLSAATRQAAGATAPDQHLKVEVACCSANAWVCVCLAIPHVLTAHRRLPQVSLGLELAPTCDVQADLGSLPSVFILGTQKAARANPRPCASAAAAPSKRNRMGWSSMLACISAGHHDAVWCHGAQYQQPRGLGWHLLPAGRRDALRFERGAPHHPTNWQTIISNL